MGAALNKKDVTGLRQKRHSVHECKKSLNLAYKIVNYAFDSEISQTAGAKEYKPTQGVGRGGKNTLRLRQTPSKRMFQLKLFCGDNFYTHTVGPLPQPKVTIVNQTLHL